MSTNKISKVQLNDQEYLLKGDAQNIKDVMAQTISDLYSRIDTGSDTTIISEILERLNSLEVDKATKDQIEELWRQINGMNQQIPNSVLNYYFAYKQSDEAPARPEDSEEYPPQGWKSYPETPDSDKIIYMTMARKLNGEYQRWADNHRWTQPIAYGDKTRQTLNIESNIALYRLSSGTPSLSEQERKTPSYPNGWSTTPDFLVQNNKEVYMITAKTINGKYIEVGGYYWSVPMRIGGGTTSTTGSDTTVYNYVYYPSTDGTPPSTPQFTVRQIEDNDEIDGWYDSPQGIQEDRKYEYISLSIGESLDRSNWSSPVLWSKWGERGMDGDGVEYIYTRNNHGAIPVINYDMSDPAYQEDDYIPTNWTDQPKGVSENLAYEFVAQRKQKDGVWQRFSNPGLWAKYGKNGQQGNQGINGAVVRYIGDWSSVVENATNHEFVFECNTPEGANIRYIDVVTMPSADNRLDYYQCKEAYTTNANSPSPDQDSTHWEPAQHYKFLVTDALIANYIASNTISANDVIIKEGEGQNMSIVAGMTSSTAEHSTLGDVRIWAGTEGDQPNIQEAPFIVNNKGELYSENARIQGQITANGGKFNGDVFASSLSVVKDGNIALQFKVIPEGGITDSNNNQINIAAGTPALFVYTPDGDEYVIDMTKLSSNSSTQTVFRSTHIYPLVNQSQSESSIVNALLNQCHTENGVCYQYARESHVEANITRDLSCYEVTSSSDPELNGVITTSNNINDAKDHLFTGYCIELLQDAVQVSSGSDPNTGTYMVLYWKQYYNKGKKEMDGVTSRKLNEAYRIGTYHVENGNITSDIFDDFTRNTQMQTKPIMTNYNGFVSYSQYNDIQAQVSQGQAPNPGQID